MKIKPEKHTGLRALAGIIDYGIIYGFTYIIVSTFGEPIGNGTYILSGFPVLIPMFFWLFMTVILECGLGGTIGNSIVGIKVIPMNGRNRKLTFIESLKRHLLDPIDMFFFGLIGYITINNSEKHQRVGDIWGKTIVAKMKNIEKEESKQND